MKALDLLNLIEDGEGPGLNAVGVVPTGPLHKLKKILYKLKESLQDGKLDDTYIQEFADFGGIDAEQLKIGFEVEKEHIQSMENLLEIFLTAIEFDINDYRDQIEDVKYMGCLMIARDHILEIPDYYTRLKKMEEEAKKEISL